MTLISIVDSDISCIIPLIYAYKDKTKKHILLCESDISKHKLAKRLKNGINGFASKHGFSWEVKIAVVDKYSVNLSKQIELTSDTILNISNSTPILILLLTQCILENGGKVVSYNYPENTIFTLHPDNSTTHRQLLPTMDIDSYMRLQNFSIKSQREDSSLSSRKKHIFKLYKKEHLYKKVKNILLYEDDSFDKSSYKETLEIFRHLGVVDKLYNLIQSKRQVLQGDMLEEYVYWLCKELKPDDIAVGIKIDFDKDKCHDEQKKIYNEFDVLILDKNRIYTIECKYKKYLQGRELIYKHDSIMDYFGGYTKAIMVNISNKSENFNHSTIRRANIANIAIYHEAKVDAKKFQELVREFFRLEEKR
jgi:hypothetical protein